MYHCYKHIITSQESHKKGSHHKEMHSNILAFISILEMKFFNSSWETLQVKIITIKLEPSLYINRLLHMCLLIHLYN